MNKNYNDNENARNITDYLKIPIVLVGMMGAGKSHIGGTLSKYLGIDFFDSDKIIEERAGYSIREIFEHFGESKFRESETNVVLKLLGNGPCVIATGGGVLTSSETLQAIKGKSVSIWLNPDLDILVSRVQGHDSRPLLDAQNPEEKLSALLKEREVLYAQADIRLDIHADNKQETLGNITKLLSEHLNSARF